MLSFLVSHLKSKDLTSLTLTFKALDIHKKGIISIQDLKSAAVSIDKKIKLSDIEKGFTHANFSKSGSLNFTEFLIMAICNSNVINSNDVQYAFSYFDT